MKIKLNQQDEELSEKNVKIKELQHQLHHQNLPNTNKTLVGCQTEKVGIYLLNDLHKLYGYDSFVVVV